MLDAQDFGGRGCLNSAAGDKGRGARQKEAKRLERSWVEGRAGWSGETREGIPGQGAGLGKEEEEGRASSPHPREPGRPCSHAETPSQTPRPLTPTRNPSERVLGNGDKWFAKQRQRKGRGRSTTFPPGTPRTVPLVWKGPVRILADVLFLRSEGEVSTWKPDAGPGLPSGRGQGGQRKSSHARDMLRHLGRERAVVRVP